MNAILALKGDKKGRSILYSKNKIESEQAQLNFQGISLFFISQFRYLRKKVIYSKLKQQAVSGQHRDHQYKEKTLSIEISSEKMERLLALHCICAEDIRCLNMTSRQCLQRLCLKTCLKNRQCLNYPKF